MENVQVSLALLNSIVGYLGTKPFQEVHQLIEAVQKEVQKALRKPRAKKTVDKAVEQE